MSKSNVKKATPNTKIVVITSGWVVLGEVVQAKSDSVTRIEDASVIRVWGTTEGIGEIALKGPTPSTVLDYAGVVEVKDHAVIMVIDCIF